MAVRPLRIFVSSVRRGLEEERDALRGLVLALGHVPVRFEDFTAQGVPSREACLQGVESADAYLLLLGPHYGDPLPDTGVAPTEEELTVARRRGIPIRVFKKSGVEVEPRQQDFIRRIEEFRAGFFRDSFATSTELLTTVVAAVRELEAGPSKVQWLSIQGRATGKQPSVSWVSARDGSGRIAAATILEFHAVPLDALPLLVSELTGPMPGALARRGRDMGLFGDAEAVEPDSDQGAAWASGRSSGIRVQRTRATALWRELPRDSLGAIIDPVDLASRLGMMIRMAAQSVPGELPAATAVGLSGISMAVLGSVSDLGRRQSISIGMATKDWVRAGPEDAVDGAALAAAADEIARELAARLIQAYRATRR